MSFAAQRKQSIENDWLEAEVVDNYRAIGVTLQNRPIFSISLHTGHIKLTIFNGFAYM